jgi:hypothetical protein
MPTPSATLNQIFAPIDFSKVLGFPDFDPDIVLQQFSHYQALPNSITVVVGESLSPG